MYFKENQYQFSPSDLANHLHCKHLTELNKKAARGELEKPMQQNRVIQMLAERGEDFETNFLEQFVQEGKSVVQIERDDKNAAAKTVEAMKQGADVIYQARLKEENAWSGWADFLVKRTDKPSELGSWSYEVIDTKHATETKAATILQIGLYSEAVANIQGVMPEFMKVQTPEEMKVYRVDDYIYYVRFARENLESALRQNEDTYPEPVPHCDVCNWWKECNRRRREDDHLTFIAGMGNAQIKEVRTHGVNTLAGMAKLPLPVPFVPSRGNQETYNRLREQARLQFQSREQGGNPLYEMLEVESERGLNLLPEPHEHDIFLDLEGDPLVEPGGLEYLIGYCYQGQYFPIWAHDEESEKQAFEQFMDFAAAIKKKHPGMHIYHYAAYEPSAFKRLMGKYATREDEMDEFLRSGTFVDLYRVVRQSLRAGIEQYSIKNLEVFYGYTRQIDLRDLAPRKAMFEFLLETGRCATADPEMKDAVCRYNEDDCISTKELRDWLEQRRSELIRKGQDLSRPLPKDGQAAEFITEHQQRIKPLFDALMTDVPVNTEERSPGQQARFLLAHMLDWYRREKKSFWWEYYRLMELEDEELLDERKAVSYLSFTGNETPINRSIIHAYTFPPQECDLRPGQQLKNKQNETIGEVYEIDITAGSASIKKGPKFKELPHPSAVFSMENIKDDVKEESIIAFAEWVVENGLDSDLPEYRATRDLLLKLPPRYDDNIDLTGLQDLERSISQVMHLDSGVLPVQGPPGTGKSHTASHMIMELARSGKTVGITAMSHKVIENLLHKVHQVSKEAAFDIQMVQKPSSAEENNVPWDTAGSYDEIIDSAENRHVIAGTPFMWAREDFAGMVDYLFVDEAGQLSLIDTLAVSRAACNLVLLGDPQQLKQPQQGVHPAGTEVSALEHILDGEKTISGNKGIFLDKTYRMHPDICAFDSQMFYESRLNPVLGLENQSISGETEFEGSGLFFTGVDHSGNTSSSAEEVEKVAEIVNALLSGKVYYTNKENKTRVLNSEDIKIIAPYNAQVGRLQARLPGVSIGTVDKFQGQEAPVIIYSTASSSPQDAPRGMEFLYSPNRFNVAVSRARACFIMVGSSKIFEAECKSPHQIKLANPFCRFREIAITTQF